MFVDNDLRDLEGRKIIVSFNIVLQKLKKRSIIVSSVNCQLTICGEERRGFHHFNRPGNKIVSPRGHRQQPIHSCRHKRSRPSQKDPESVSRHLSSRSSADCKGVPLTKIERKKFALGEGISCRKAEERSVFLS